MTRGDTWGVKIISRAQKKKTVRTYVHTYSLLGLLLRDSDRNKNGFWRHRERPAVHRYAHTTMLRSCRAARPHAPPPYLRQTPHQRLSYPPQQARGVTVVVVPLLFIGTLSPPFSLKPRGLVRTAVAGSLFIGTLSPPPSLKPRGLVRTPAAGSLFIGTLSPPLSQASGGLVGTRAAAGYST